MPCGFLFTTCFCYTFAFAAQCDPHRGTVATRRSPLLPSSLPPTANEEIFQKNLKQANKFKTLSLPDDLSVTAANVASLEYPGPPPETLIVMPTRHGNCVLWPQADQSSERMLVLRLGGECEIEEGEVIPPFLVPSLYLAQVEAGTVYVDVRVAQYEPVRAEYLPVAGVRCRVHPSLPWLALFGLPELCCRANKVHLSVHALP